MSSRLANRFAVTLGLLIAFVGLTLDFLMPGSSPGVSLPQLLVVFAGVGLAASPFLRRRWRGIQSDGGKPHSIVLLLIVLATLLVLEFALALAGIRAYFPANPPERDATLVSWQTCGELGCLHLADPRNPHCAPEKRTHRFCDSNASGFVDSDEFVADDSLSGRQRILSLGDSFAQGFSADMGKSYAERIEAALPDVALWNLGVSGTGTNQDLNAFKRFAPLLQPHLTLLSFFTNDFSDNLDPPGNRIRLEDGDGQHYIVDRFQTDRFGNPVDLPLDLVHAYLVAGYNPPTSELERVIGRTRIGTLLLRALDLLAESRSGRDWDDQVAVTRHYLTQLRDAVAKAQSDLLALVIPRREDINAPRKIYTTAVDLMRELEIPYMEVRRLLHPVNDYAPPPDGHWNNIGHGIVADYLLDCLETYFAADSLKVCDNVIMP